MTVSSLLGLGDGHVLEQLPLVARLPHGVETVVHDLRFGRRGVSETARSGVAATRRVDRSRQAVPRETTAARPRGEGPIRERGGGRTFSPTSAPAMTTATYTLERCAEEWRRGTGRSRSDSIEGVRVYFVVGAARGPSRRRLRIPAVAKRHAPTSRSCRTLRTWCPRFCLRGSLRALRTLPARGRGGATQT